jgi:hypothetical protein
MIYAFFPVLCLAQGFTISTVAGNGIETDSGDGGPAIKASLCDPYGVAVDSSGAVYIAVRCGNRIRKVSPDETITTVAGPSTGFASGYAGDGGPATDALLNDAEDVAVDSAGNLYIGDNGNGVVRKVTSPLRPPGSSRLPGGKTKISPAQTPPRRCKGLMPVGQAPDRMRS